MKSSRDNLHRNSYSQSITLAPRNMDRRTENNTQKLITICLPNIKGLAEKIHKKCTPYDIRTIFRSGTILQKYLFQVKHPTEFMTKNCMYSIPCSCGKVYKGEICHPLKVRLEEHQKPLCQVRLKSWVWLTIYGKKKGGNHLSLWDKDKTIYMEEHQRIKPHKEAVYILSYNDLLSRPSIEMNMIKAW